MQPRVAYVSPILPGHESEVREAHRQFPGQVLDEIGAVSVSAFIGNGYYVMVFDFLEGDFQTRFAEFTRHPQVREFFDGLGAYLIEPLPRDVQPADSFHRAAGQASGPAMTTARLPLVGEVFTWHATVH
jgi:hypothetical protein